jgi:hypothetical protein
LRNFYFVTSFNLTNPIVKTMMDMKGVSAVTGPIVDFKMRSKLFMSYGEALSAANGDFEQKALAFYTKGEHFISQFMIANPSIMIQDADSIEALTAKFGAKYLSGWDDNCCSVLFFADNSEGEEIAALNANSWLVKYEIFYSDDAIELSGNGDFAFEPMNIPRTQFSSTYH